MATRKKPEKSPEERAAARAKSNANLIPRNSFPEGVPEKGGKARAKQRREQRALREILKEMLAIELPDTAAQAVAARDDSGGAEAIARGIAQGQGHSLTAYQVTALAQIARAVQGDSRAAEFVRDSSGDKPGDVVQSAGEPITAADLELLRKVSARLAGGENE